jgi:hypothetical protein
MSGQASDTPEPVIPFAPPRARNAASDATDPLERAGQVILGMVHRAAGIADANSQKAGELEGQLRAAEDRIKDLEADVHRAAT